MPFINYANIYYKAATNLSSAICVKKEGLLRGPNYFVGGLDLGPKISDQYLNWSGVRNGSSDCPKGTPDEMIHTPDETLWDP